MEEIPTESRRERRRAARRGAARRPASRRRRILIVIASFLAVLLIGILGYAWFLNSKLDNIAREPMLPTATTDADGKKLVTGQGTNYLLIGSDAGPDRVGARADVIQLVHVPKDHSAVWLIHFPRDLYVEIPGHGEDKVNAAFAFGGAPLLTETVQNLVGVKIDHVAKTDFEGFKALTDALGGVRVNAVEASPGFQQGWNDLDGAQALAFVRERYALSEGDISRGQRQQEWLRAIMDKTLDPAVLLNPITLANVMDAGGRYTVLDETLSSEKIRSEALKMRGIRGGDIHFVTAPFAGFGTSPSGASIDIFDEAAMDRLGDALQSDDMANYTE